MVVSCIQLEMHFVVIIMVIICGEKRAGKRSQFVQKYQRESQTKQG